MVETIAPVVYGNKRTYLGAVALHALAAGVTGALFGTLISVLGLIATAPWEGVGGVLVAVCAAAYVGRELFGLPIPLFDRKRQVPDWWRTFYSPHVAAALYGAGLGIGFLTFLRFGTYVVVCVIAFVSGNPFVGAALGATFGLARGSTALMSARARDEVEASDVVTRLEEAAVGRKPRLANALVLTLVAAVAVSTACDAGTPTSAHVLPTDRATSTPGPGWLGYERPHRLGRLEDSRINESSGLVASRSHADVLWTHNDSGGGPYIYALDMSGRTLGRWLVAGASVSDWEDIAGGPDGLYIGDIGDNDGVRKSVSVYRFDEPSVSDPARRTEPAETLELRYPDGPHDAETLLVHPTTGTIYIVTKDFSGRAIVYSAPGDPGKQTLERVGRLDLTGAIGGITGGDIAPDGSRVVLCTYSGAFELVLPEDEGEFDDIWDEQAFAVGLGPRNQGEAIAYSADGRSLITTSEGARSPLSIVEAVRGDQ